MLQKDICKTFTGSLCYKFVHMSHMTIDVQLQLHLVDI